MPETRPAKRALVAFLLSLAAAYGFSLALERDSADPAVVRAVRRVLLRGVGEERASAPAKGRGWRRGEGRGERGKEGEHK